MSGQLHAPAAVPLGKSPQFTLDKNLDGLQSSSGYFGEEDDILLLLGSIKGAKAGQVGYFIVITIFKTAFCS